LVRSGLQRLWCYCDTRSPAGWRSAARLLLLSAVILLASPANAQLDIEEPLLPQDISEQDVDMSGRYARQWRQDDGTLVVQFTGGFTLTMGRRHLSANDAVVWITPRHATPDHPKYYELTVYLSGDAQVQEFGGTTMADRVLLVSNLRTHGRIAKSHDAHSPESNEQSALYQQAQHDRAAIEAGLPLAPEPTAPPEVEPLVVAPVVRPDRPPAVIRYNLPNVEPAETPDGLPVYVVTRTAQQRVYFGRAGGPDSAMLEIQADNAVIFPGERFARGLLGTAVAGEQHEPADADRPTTVAQPAATPAAADSTTGLPALEAGIRGVYLEGDVLLSLGTSFVRASRLYYDFERDRALILDAVFRTDIPERNIPLYVRAAEIRQLSATEYYAEDARITTSEFHTPHYHVGVERIRLRDLTPRDAGGRPAGKLAGQYELHNATVNVETFPILWWPYARGPFETSETGLRRLRTGHSSQFGAEIETSWHLFNLLGVETPPGYDATARFDYFSQRGPATGIDVDYQREDHFGLLRNYYIFDEGEDHLGVLRRHEREPDSKHRGRALWRHRHYLPDDWEVTFEASYISDPNFLEEYERAEFNEGKEQETLVYLKRAREVDAISLLANWRLLDSLTQTEHLPELAYRRIGDTFLSPLVMYHESRVGGVRYRPDDRYPVRRWLRGEPGPTDLTFRTDLRQEVELPLKLAALNIVPFATWRASYWDGQPGNDGHVWRGMGIYGLRGSTVFSRVFDDVESELLNIHRLRHIVKPEFVAWWAHSNTRSESLTPFDYGIETIDDFYGCMVALRQTWQTQRGAETDRRTVDLLTLNLETGLFGDAHGRNQISNGWVNPLRPENSRTRNYAAGDLIYRLSDTTSLLYEFNVDLNDWSLDRHNVAVAVERSPRLAYVLGYRHAGDIDLELVGGGWNYKLTERHITSVRMWFDIDRGDFGEVALAYVRKLPRWYVAISVEYDRIDDDLSVSLSVWPEGVPEWTVGSRRYTRLGTSTGIRP
jgi:hypothetical protein